MWECDWKDGEVPDKQPYTKACDYKYTLELDFNSLKSYIERREEKRRRSWRRTRSSKLQPSEDGEGEGDEEARTQ